MLTGTGRTTLTLLLVCILLLPARAPVAAATAEVAMAETTAAELRSIVWESNETFEITGDPKALKGGTLRFSIPSYPTTLRSYGPNANTMVNSMFDGLCYETLTGIHPTTLRVIPSLANAWSIGPDKKTFYFRIHPKALWSDGKPVIASDVVDTWDFLQSKEIQDPFYLDHFSKFERPEALDLRTVKIVSKQLDWRAFMSAGGIMVQPGHYLRGLAPNYIKDYQFKLMVGSGPYTFGDTVKGRSISLKRRTDYWALNERGNMGQNNFDVIDFIVIMDESLRFESIKKGDIDIYYVNVAKQWATQCDFDQVRMGWIQKRKIFTDKPNGIQGLAFNMREEPFDDVRVRKAFFLMYPREIMIKKLFYSQYLPLHSYFPGGIYANPTNQEIGYDPDQAVKLLQEAGWTNWDGEGRLVKNGKPLEVTILYDDPSTERILTVVQEYYRDIGIVLKLKLSTQETIWKLQSEFKFKLNSAAWGGLLFPNPVGSYHTKMADKVGSTNITGVRDPEIDKWIDSYDGEFDLDRRIEIIKKIDRKLTELYPYALGWYAPYERMLYANRFGMPDCVLTKTGDYRTLVSLWWVDPEKDKALARAKAENGTLPVGTTEVTFWPEYNERMAKARAAESGGR